MKLLKPNWVSHQGQSIFSIDIHPDGSRFVTGGQTNDGGTVIVWNMKPVLSQEFELDQSIPKVLCELTNHLGCVNCVRWSRDGKYLASGGDDSILMIWNIRYKGLPGGNPLFGSDHPVYEHWGCLHMLRGHNGDILDVAWSHDQHYLASCSVDNSIIIWNALKFPQKVTVISEHSGLVKGLAWDPVGKYLSSQSDDKTLRVWRTDDWKQECQVTRPFEKCGGTTHVLRLSWSPDGRFIVSAHSLNNDGPTAHIIERNWNTGMDFVGHRKAIEVVQFNSHMFSIGEKDNHGCLAIGSRDRSLSIWLTSLKRPLVVIRELFDNSILDLSWTSDGYSLMACSLDGTVAFVSFSKQEIGETIDQSNVDDLYIKLYGNKRSNASVMSNLIIEDPSMLSANPELLVSKGNAKVTPVKAESDSLPPLPTLKNDVPILKQQVESRTPDGKRRITPVMITSQPVDAPSSSNPFAASKVVVTPPKAIPSKEPAETSNSEIVNVKSPPARPISFTSLPSVKSSTPASPTRSLTAAKALITTRQKRPSETDHVSTTDSTALQLPKAKKSKKTKSQEDVAVTKPTSKSNKMSAGSLKLSTPPLASSLSLQLPTVSLNDDKTNKILEVTNMPSSGMLAYKSDGTSLWTLPLLSPALIISANHRVTCIGSLDNTVVFISTATGRLLTSRLLLPAPPYKIVVVAQYVAVATTDALISVYDTSLLKTTLSKISFGHMTTQIQDITLTKGGVPVVVTTENAYAYNGHMDAWMELKSAIERSEIYLSQFSLPSETPSLSPLQTIQRQTTSRSIDGSTSQLGHNENYTLAYLESQLSRCLSLRSSFEYEHWLKCYVKYLVDRSMSDRLREFCVALDVNGLYHRKEIIQNILSIIATNTVLQRVYCELRDIFNSKHFS